MSAADLTSVDPILKQLYVGQRVPNLTYERRPFFGMIPKFEKFTGRNYPIPLAYANPQGRSTVFATAQSNVTPVKYDDFLLTRVKDYSIALVDGETAEAAMDDKGSFLRAMTNEIDRAMASLADAIETFLFRSGTGSIGQISSGSTVTSDTITLESIHDVTNFEPGMTLKAAATDGGSVRTGSEVLEGVNRSTGQLTATSAQWDTVITAIAASDFLSVEGDGANGGSNVKISGLEAWIPATAPTSGDSFFGVDRSDDSRKHGQRHTGTSQTIEEAIIDGQSIASREGGRIDYGLYNHVQNRRLKKELGAKTEYQKNPAKGSDGKEVASVSYRSVVLEGDTGPIQMTACNKCPADVIWLLEMKSWKLYSLGPATKFLALDNQKILRQAAADSYESRIGFRGNLGGDAPGFNCRVSVSVPS